jgi:branched-chain amino acid transport system substrate-binding protein
MSNSSDVPAGSQSPSPYAPRWVRASEQPRIHSVNSAPPREGAQNAVHERRFPLGETRLEPEVLPPPPLSRRRSFVTRRELALLAFAAMMAAFAILVIYPRSPPPEANRPAGAAGVPASQSISFSNASMPASTELVQPPPMDLPVFGDRQTVPASADGPTQQPAAVITSVPRLPTTVATTSASVSMPAVDAQRPAGPTVRGVTDSEIVFGMSAAFSGSAKELGRQMKLGVETAFSTINAAGGINGRQLRLIAADDGYEPNRTVEAMKQLYERDQVFGIIGNVGTPTAMVALPYALERKMLFFGAFTGAGLLRRDPPDRYVFNYRASYAEETDSVVRYLVKVRRLRPEQIAVFAQEDGYGDSGFMGVTKAVRALRGGDAGPILRLNYKRNTVDVDDAVARLRQQKGAIKAVVMVPTYRAAAKFIEKTRDLFPDMIYTNVSFVGSTALSEELMLLGRKYAEGVIVTQVVPAIEGHSSLVLEYKAALAKNFPGEAPDYVSLEGYVAGGLLAEGVKRAGSQLDTEKLVDALETVRDFDPGLGTPLTFGRTEHQASHKVWGTQLDKTGRYQPIDLQ